MAKYYRERIGELNCVLNQCNSTPEKVVILCHGFGAPGTDLVPIGDEILTRHPGLDGTVQFIFPAAPVEMDFGEDSRAWWPISMSQFETLAEPGGEKVIANFVPDELPDCHAHLVSIIQHVCSTYEIEPKNVFVGGFSQGAMLTTDVFLRSGLELGGLIVWSGTLINQAAWNEAIEQNRPGRVVQSHGLLDPVLSFPGATALRNLLQKKHHVDFVSFQGYHQIPPQAIELAAKLIEGV
ncbi:MAG: hypothetical protein R3C03_12310 [Pirellulaceae bacterium]